MKANRLALLMECHEREMMGLEPIKATEARSVKTLVKDNLVEVVQFQPKDGPPYIAVKISASGKRLLHSELSKK